MSRAVWKFEATAHLGVNEIRMPAGARIVHVEHQSPIAAVVTFWAEVPDDGAGSEEIRRFAVVGTGHPVPEGGAYVGTDCVNAGLVLHLYELPAYLYPLTAIDALALEAVSQA